MRKNRNQWLLGALFTMCLGSLLSAPLGRAQFSGPGIGSTAQKTGVPDSTAAPDAPEARILPGDIIAVQVLGAPELNTLMQTASSDLSGRTSSPIVGVRVGARGEVEVPYAGTVIVGGMTPSAAAAAISSVLKDKGILVDPHVTVRLVDSPSRVITVVGEVKNPTPVPAFASIHLLDAISACGGFTSAASHTITVRRPGQSEPLTVEIATDPRSPEIGNIALVPGDTVIVPTVGNFFVLGQVKNQQAFPLIGNAPVTVLRALAMAGGVNYSAAMARARVIRPVGGNRQVEIMFDLRKVMEGKQQDIALNANDILFIPTNTFKLALSSGGAQVAATLLYGSAYMVNMVK